MSLRDKTYNQLSRIALTDFPDIVEGTKLIEGKLRLFLSDNSFVDVWFSEKRKGIYAYHWDRKAIDETIYRYNNLPDKEAKKLKTFPKHFHDGSEKSIRESDLSDSPEEALKSILSFARDIIQETTG